MSSDPGVPSAAPVPDRTAMAGAVAAFLRAAGRAEEATGPAPERTAAAWIDDLLCGYATDPVSALKPTWPDSAGDIVAVTDIPFVSVCAHHLLPFFGRAHVAYAPGDHLTGLSRIEELVYCLSRRLQVQERLGEAIAEALERGVEARGTAVMLEAEHLCVFARGRRRRASVTRTLALSGEVQRRQDLQARCLALLQPAAREAQPETRRDEELIDHG